MISRFYRFEQVTGLTVTLYKERPAGFAACSVRRQGDTLEITGEKTGGGIPDLKGNGFDSKYPVCLNLTGKGILYREMPAEQEINASSFGSILPGAILSDFYLQSFVSGTKKFVAVVRKSDADKWITELADAGFMVLLLIIGPFAFEPVRHQMNFYDREIVFYENRITLGNDDAWETFAFQQDLHASFKIKIGVREIHERFLLPYAAAMQLIMLEKIHPEHAAVPVLDNNLLRARKDRKLKVWVVMVLLFFFLVLLVNAFLFSWLYKSNERLAESLQVSAQNISNNQDLAVKLKEKQALLQDMGWDDDANRAVMIDRLFSLLPGNVIITEIVLNPLTSTPGKIDKGLEFDNRKINVYGLSGQVTVVNEWIARIKTLKWVKGIELKTYTYNSAIQNGQFSIMINY